MTTLNLKRRKNLMEIADKISEMATCDRAHVGCVLVRGKRIIATGYNGSPSGMPHCDDAGHDMEEGHCIRTIHAEENAIFQCAEYGVSCRGAVAISTTQPCHRCYSRLFAVGVREIWFRDKYREKSPADRDRLRILCEKGLRVYQLSEAGHIVDCSPGAGVPYNSNPNRNSPKMTQLW